MTHPQHPLPPARPKRRSVKIRRLILHVLRACLLGMIVMLIHWQHEKLSPKASDANAIALGLSEVRDVLPNAARLGEASNHGGREILDAAGKSLGVALQTSPQADEIIGFSGPTNLLLVFDEKHQLRGLKILSSGDTQEHVRAIQNDPQFLQSLGGKNWEQLAQGDFEVDAVSGATLTSVAIWESLVKRLGGGGQPSLRFPDPITLKEVQLWFPAADSLGTRNGTYGLIPVYDRRGNQMGSVLRTSPATDRLIGYQGPTESLIGFDAGGKCLGIRLRKSYDNEEYVNYVREEDYFLSLWGGMTLPELAALDLDKASVEGVSGATMTSRAVAEGLKLAAADWKRQQDTPPKPKEPAFSLRPRDVGTALVLLGGLLIGFTNLRGKKWVRVPFQVLLIGYLGFINGDLVSQALLVGWAEHGIPWRAATGLVLLTGAAVLVPLVSRHNVYCHHLCPHGAAQQLLKNRLPWRVSLPKWLVWMLSAIPAVLLVLVVLVPMLSLSLSLVNLEPFDAYVFRIAGTATLAIFFGGLAASLFVPMAYCRFGCPTGALLGFLRFHGHSDRLSLRDAVAIGLLTLALLLFATT